MPSGKVHQPADRILAGPELIGELFVDDDDAMRRSWYRARRTAGRFMSDVRIASK